MWEPDPSWQRLRGGPSSGGVWRVTSGDATRVVKRLVRPTPDDDPATRRPDHPAYWRREAEAALAPGFVDGPGLRHVPAAVEEDDDGVCVWRDEVTGEPPTGLQVARCLGAFAAASYDEVPRWATHDLLRRRLELAERGGGWRTLARTTLADVTALLWERREHWLSRLAELPAGRGHGDVVPGNLLASRGAEVVAVDWQCVGVGPVGADLGYWSLSRPEDFEVLLDAFAVTGVDREQAAVAARVTAVYTVLSRAERALAQAAAGEGALAGKFRHPSVAPYLRAVQRQFPQVEALL